MELLWHAMPEADVAHSLNTDANRGLTWAAVRHLASARPPALKPRSRMAIEVLFNQLKGAVILILVAAAMISFALGDYGNAIGIGASVIFAVLFGFLTDYRAERALAALKMLSAPSARVLREGLEHEVTAANIQVGDVLILAAGSRAAADARLIEERDLTVDESALTGESAPVHKLTDLFPEGTPLADRRNMIYAGTTITSGYGRALVTAVEDQTELGRIGRLVAESEAKETPLEKQAEQLGRRLALLVVILCAAFTLFGLWRGHPWLLMLETGIILAIAAIPEGLPAVTTVALAGGLHRMVRAHSLVRRLAAVETLGSASVICADKTGTMTENAMTAVRVILPDRSIHVTGVGYVPRGDLMAGGKKESLQENADLAQLLRIAVLCNNAELESHDGWHIHGSPTEGALLTLAAKAGVDGAALRRDHARQGEQAFTSDRKRMSVVVQDAKGRYWALVKGAASVVAPLCSSYIRESQSIPLDESDLDRFLAADHTLAEEGHRVLAFAYKPLPETWSPAEIESHLTWVGLVGLMDPPRPGVAQAITTLLSAGVRTVMLTGDQKGTALAIARQLGIPESDVHARVTPEDKLALVKSLQASKAVVAMTGDGINDAPALKAADIGIAMGAKSTDVAKEASDMVVTDGNFATLALAVEEGRQIYGNLQRATKFLLLCSFSSIGVMAGGVLAGLPLPMTPLQILWLNLVVHIFPGLALGLVPGTPDLMNKPPRQPGSPLVTWAQVGGIAARSLLIAGIGLALFLRGLHAEGLAHAQTLAMAVLGVSLLLQLFAFLSDARIFLFTKQSLSPILWGAIVIGILIQSSGLYFPPLAKLLHTQPLSWIAWRDIAAASVAALLMLESFKWLGTRIGGITRTA